MTQPPKSENSNPDVVYEACLLLVTHFRNLIQLSRNNLGFHTRVFSHMLHPEREFVYAGHSENVTAETPKRDTHPEHVVPCATLVTECQRLIKAGTHSDEAIAVLLQKHWKVATITKKEKEILDSKSKLGYKSTMPTNWTFETGNTFARFIEAKIVMANS